MHPRVVGMQIAPPDQQQPPITAICLFKRGPQAFYVGSDWWRRKLDFARYSTQRLWNARLEGTKINAMGVRFQRCQIQTCALCAKTVPIGTATQQVIDDTLRATPRLQSGEDLGWFTPLNRGSGRCYIALNQLHDHHFIENIQISAGSLTRQDACQPQQHLPFIRHPRFTFEDSGRVVHKVANGELVEGGIEVRGRRENYIGVARRFVEIDIHTNHEFQHTKSLLEPMTVGRAQRGIAANRDHGLHLPISWSFDLFGQTDSRQLTKEFRQPPHTAMPAPKTSTTSLARHAAGITSSCRSLREHHATFTVKIAGQDIEYIDQPACQRAKLLGAGTDTPIDDSMGRTRKLTSEPANVLRSNAADRRNRFGSKMPGQFAYLFKTGDMLRKVFGIDQSFREKRVYHCEEQMSIAAGTNKMVLVSFLGGPCTIWVDDHNFAATLMQTPQPPAHIRGGHQAAIRNERIRAEQQQVIGSIYIGNRNSQPGAKHQRR